MANQIYLLEMKDNVTSPNDFVVATIKKKIHICHCNISNDLSTEPCKKQD